MAKKVIVRTTAAPFKVRVKVEPVAWRNGKVLKYKGAVVVTDSKKQSRQIGGDPAESKTKAIENLRRELATFAASVQKGIQYINALIDYRYITGMPDIPTTEQLDEYIKACEKAKEKSDGKGKKAGDTANQGA